MGKRTWDISVNYTVSSGKLNLALSGVLLLTFMTIHLFQYRFGETLPYKLCPPPYLVNVKGILSLNLFWVECDEQDAVPVRDISRLEVEGCKARGGVLLYRS